MGVKPEVKEHLAQRASNGLPEVWQAPLSEIRKNTQSHIALKQPLIDIHEVRHLSISGPTSQLPIRIYRPTGETNLPALVYFHGGGWVLNFLDVYEPSLRKIANHGKFIIIAVEYQKAPENPYPTPFNDCYEGLKWTIENAAELGIDPLSIGVGGDSAGGNLAAAVAIKARDEKLINLAFQLLIYPCLDVNMEYKSATDFAEGYGLTTKAMIVYRNTYPSHPVASLS
jgi:acetyl esterase